MKLAFPSIRALDKVDLAGAPVWVLTLRPSRDVYPYDADHCPEHGVSHKVQTIVCLALTIIPMTCRIVLLPLGIAVLFPFPGLSSSDSGSLVLSESAYFTKAAIRVDISLQ